MANPEGMFFFNFPGGMGGPMPNQPQQPQPSHIDVECKELPDDPSIPVGKVDKWMGHGFAPYNYDPKTGVVNE